jgi:hypothetical protein
MIIQVVFSNMMLSSKQLQMMKQDNHNNKVHLIIGGSHFIWVKNGIQMLILAFTKLIIGLHIAIVKPYWKLMTILYSKIAKVSL